MDSRTLRPMAVIALFAAVLAVAVALVAPDGDAAPAAQRNEELRAELLRMMDEDQKERMGDPSLAPGTKLGPSQDYTRMARLREIIDEHGWPTRSLVGEDGAEAAWLIAQHADLDVEFQERALGLLREAVENGEASPGDLAYLTDRVATNRKQPQTYGTQTGCDGGRATPGPIADEAGVDERRRAAGLGPLADYLAELRTMCASEPEEIPSEAPGETPRG